MNKKIVFCFLIINLLGIGKVIPVLEVGDNKIYNLLSKIEAVKQTTEQVRQTQQKIQQLRNEATNLNSWAATALKDTLGLTTQDINNLLEIKRLSGEIYQDAATFDKNFYKDFDLDITKLSINDLRFADDKLIEKINKNSNNVINYKKREKKELDTLQKKISKLNQLNSQTTGNLNSQQLSNEINANIYQSLEKLNILFQAQRAEEMMNEKRQALLRSSIMQQKHNAELEELKKQQKAEREFFKNINKYSNPMSINQI